MSMTTVNAKIYIARILGGANTQSATDMAGEALQRGYQDWADRNWDFLLKDTSLGFPIAGPFNVGSATFTAPSSAAFDGVNIGVGVTITVVTLAPTLAAGTVVSSYTRNSDGTVQTITLSNAVAGTGTFNMVFAGDIPIIQGTNDYNAPADFKEPYDCKLIGIGTNVGSRRPLTFKSIRNWDRTIWNDTQQGIPWEYTVYSPYSHLTQNFGMSQHIRFDRIPSEANVLRIRYYRTFVTDGTNIDIPNYLLYKFLDYCQGLLLARKRAQDNPESFLAQSQDALETAKENDAEPSEDNDDDNCMKSQYEMGDWNRPLWSNGNFDATR